MAAFHFFLGWWCSPPFLLSSQKSKRNCKHKARPCLCVAALRLYLRLWQLCLSWSNERNHHQRKKKARTTTQTGETRATPTTMKGNQHRKERAAYQPHKRQGFAPASPWPLRGDLVSPPCGSGHSHFPLGGGFPCPPWSGGLRFPPLGTAFSSLFRKATYPVDLAKK